jgi:hypothetical protein
MFGLYHHVLNEQQDREPLFAQQSTVNWIRALRHEIEAEHGVRVEDRLKACRLILRGSRKTNPVPSPANPGRKQAMSLPPPDRTAHTGR